MQTRPVGSPELPTAGEANRKIGMPGMRALRIATSVAFLLTAGGFFWVSTGLNGNATLEMFGLEYPTAVVGATVLCLACMVAIQVAAPAAAPEIRAAPGRAARLTRLRFACFILTWIGYAVLLPYLGYLVTTTLAGAALLVVLHRSRLWVAISGAVLGALAMSVVFQVIFYVSIPRSIVDDRVYTFVSGLLQRR